MKDRVVKSNKYLRSLNIIILESNPEVFTIWCLLPPTSSVICGK